MTMKSTGFFNNNLEIFVLKGGKSAGNERSPKYVHLLKAN